VIKCLKISRLVFGTGLVFFLLGCTPELTSYWYKESVSATYTQVDRVGLPAVRMLLISDDFKEQFGSMDLSKDEEVLLPKLSESVVALRARLSSIVDLPVETDPLTPDEVAAKLTPDFLSIDLSKSFDFSTFNGRRHGDPAEIIMLRLITGRPRLTDELPEKKESFTGRYPYLNRPIYEEEPTP